MKKYIQITSVTLLLITAINATVAGVLFIIDPSGSLMGMNITYLNHSPFSSFLIPGIVLLIVNGILNFIPVYYIVKQKSIGYSLMIIQGILLCGWITIQIIMVRDIMALHVIMFSFGIVIIGAGYWLLKNRE